MHLQPVVCSSVHRSVLVVLAFEHSSVNTREGKKLFKLKNNVGIRTNGSTVTMNKFRLEIKTFVTIGAVRF